MQHLLIFTLITFAAEHLYAQKTNSEHQGPQTCGGRLKGPVGTITTPNFPNPFPVPIKCKWIIEHDIVNGTISIYFTQQYTTSGLTFTEYMYYDETYKLGEKRALTVTEENITRIKRLQVQSPVLVMELKLNRLEGTQLRALGLLSVFGFNITYAVRGPTDSPGPSSCSAIECRLLGHCLARHDYQEFYCSCFESYSGADCGIGPLCPKTSNMCKNGGTCRQMGPAAFSCICAPGYTGDLCEASIATPECGVEECAEMCKDGTACDCNPKDTDFSSARFETRLQVVDHKNVNISQEIIKQLTSYLKALNITVEDKVEILNTSSLEANGARWVWVRVWGARREAGVLRGALAHLTTIGRLRLLPATLHFDMQPALSLHALVVNQRTEVWEGSEFILTCMAYGSSDISFTWYKDGVKINFNGTTRTLLRLAPGREVWEDLYPAGSVLKLYNVQKSSEFRCQVSSIAGTNAKGVTMWTLEGNDEACDNESSHGLDWLKTAPGAYASAACPSGYSGETTRYCKPKTAQYGSVKWMLPDFSGCVSDSLRDIYEQFTLISYGYSWGNVSDILRQYATVLRSLAMYPGQGEPPLIHSRHILRYLMSSAAQQTDRYHSVEHLLKIYDNLLKYPDAFLDEEKIYNLQNALIGAAGFKNNIDERFHEFTVKTKTVSDDKAVHFDLQPTLGGIEEWNLVSAGVELVTKTGNVLVVIVLYYNLGARLPSLRRSIEFKSGRAVEYALASQQVQVSITGTGMDATLHHTVTLLFAHSKNYSAVASKFACGLRTESEPRTWRLKACELRMSDSTHVVCRCSGLGTVALLTIARSTLTDAEKDLRNIVKITVNLGGGMCLAAALLQLLGLATSRKARLPVLLKATTAGTHSAAVLTLLECNTRQGEACPGTLGWVCAACWCAGCAALCAQPLLLHAELAGRAQRAPSVGLLAGVCTLAWLTARIWGGSPLQLGAAAAGVCGAGIILLSSLTLALTLCAARTLRSMTRKLPPDRQSHITERSRVVQHTIVLLFTTSTVQAAGVAYAQPGERNIILVVILSVTTLANGLAMLICYVIRDKKCLQAVRRLLMFSSNREWEESPVGDTSLSLYIKQDCEVESFGGVGESSSPASADSSYWRAQPIESPSRMHRRQSNPDSRADIVRCVEYKDSVLSPHRYDTHAVCDLIPTGALDRATAPEYMARVCLEIGMLRSPPAKPPESLLKYSNGFEPYTDQRFDTDKETCKFCSQSNPDVSKMPQIKSCLKKSKSQFTSSTSLPSIHHECGDEHSKSHIEQVNRQWNKAYDTPHTDRMLNKISHDLDFLLNRTQSSKNSLEQIEEAPT